MKALAAVFWVPLWAAKLRKELVSCPENQFPVTNLTVEGLGFHEDVLAAAERMKLQENLAGHPAARSPLSFVLGGVSGDFSRYFKGFSWFLAGFRSSLKGSMEEIESTQGLEHRQTVDHEPHGGVSRLGGPRFRLRRRRGLSGALT